MNGRHVEIARLKAFLLYESKLDDEEHTHLAKCNDCMETMVEAVRQELIEFVNDRSKEEPPRAA